MTPLLLLCLLAATGDETGTEPAAFSFVEVEFRFAPLILNDTLLVRAEREVKVVELADGRRAVIAVASTVLEGGSPRDRLVAERVCRMKALATLVARENPPRLTHSEELIEGTTIIVENGREHGTSRTEVRRTIHTRVEGTVHDMPVVGRWVSPDGARLYLAIGEIIPTKAQSAADRPMGQSRLRR